jgi:hypothetical protein
MSARCRLIAALILSCGLSGGCDSGRGAQFIGMDDLRDGIAPGQPVPLASVIGHDVGRVCVLSPYQPELAGDVPGHVQANAYLKSIRYKADESHWALVLIQPDGTQVARFSRSEKLDILSTAEVRSGAVSGLPSNFSASDCADVRNAAFAKIAFRGRQYVILGKLD